MTHKLSDRTQMRQGLLLAAPAFLIVLIFTYIPSVYVLGLSFFDWDLISPTATFTGLTNYARLFSRDAGFWNAFLRTLQYTVLFIPLTLCVSLFIAIRVTRAKHHASTFQTLFFIPSVTSISVIALIWSYLFNPQIGPVNSLLKSLGIPDTFLPQWLNSTTLALPTIALIGVWQNMGFMVLLFISGLNNIPRTYYEAAAIDGATRWKEFRSITWPLLGPVTYYVLFMLMINSFKVFDIVSIMTKGRPQGSTSVLLYYIYQQAFQFFDAGLSAAASWLVFLVLMGLFLVQQKLGERNVHYQ